MEALVPHWIVYASLWVAADAARLIAVPRRHRVVLERAIVSRLEFLRGATVRALTDVLEAWGVRPRWARSCRSLLASRRAAAVTDIGLLGDPALTGVVLPLLRDRDLRVRTSAVRAFGRMQSSEGAAEVLASVAPTPRGNVPMWVAMEGLAFPTAEDAVRDAITDDSPQVRAAAAHAATLSGWPSTAAQLGRASHAKKIPPYAPIRSGRSAWWAPTATPPFSKTWWFWTPPAPFGSQQSGHTSQ